MTDDAIKQVAEEYRRQTPASRRHWEQPSEFITGGYSSVGRVRPYPTVITLANGPLGDSDFDGSVGPADVSVFVNGTTTGVTTTASMPVPGR